MLGIGQENGCKALSSTGRKCGARALKGKDYCFFHQPDKNVTREAQIKGGKKGKRKPKNILKVESMEDIRVILQDTINDVRNSAESDVTKARVLGYVISILLRYFEIKENEQIFNRIKALEDRIK